MKRPDKSASQKRVAARNWQLKTDYGITLKDFSVLLYKQHGACAICSAGNVKLVVDHCHKTGKIRGLLCRPCNTMLGFSRDNEMVLTSAVQYLRKSVQ